MFRGVSYEQPVVHKQQLGHWSIYAQNFGAVSAPRLLRDRVVYEYVELRSRENTALEHTTLNFHPCGLIRNPISSQ